MQGISPKRSDGQKTPPESSSTVVLMTIADTSWRMFVPSVGLTLLGAWLDGKFSSTPWLLFIGMILGVTIAVVAVVLQLKKIW